MYCTLLQCVLSIVNLVYIVIAFPSTFTRPAHTCTAKSSFQQVPTPSGSWASKAREHALSSDDVEGGRCSIVLHLYVCKLMHCLC